MFWRKKVAQVETKREPTQVTLSSADMLSERAEKIWRLLGFANDRLGMVARLTGLLATYDELDRKEAERKQRG